MYPFVFAYLQHASPQSGQALKLESWAFFSSNLCPLVAPAVSREVRSSGSAGTLHAAASVCVHHPFMLAGTVCTRTGRCKRAACQLTDVGCHTTCQSYDVRCQTGWLGASVLSRLPASPAVRKISRGNRALGRALHHESINDLVQAAVDRGGLHGGPYSRRTPCAPGASPPTCAACPTAPSHTRPDIAPWRRSAHMSGSSRRGRTTRRLSWARSWSSTIRSDGEATSGQPAPVEDRDVQDERVEGPRLPLTAAHPGCGASPSARRNTTPRDLTVNTAPACRITTKHTICLDRTPAPVR